MDDESYRTESTETVRSKLFERLADTKRQYDKAVDQIGVLDQQMRDLEIRYKRAVKNKKNSFRYNLRLKLSVVTGIKMMYNHYATKKAEEMRLCTQWLETLYNNEAQNYDQGEGSSSLENMQDSPPAASPSSSVFSHSADDYSSSGSDV